jgi:hypothetical protein
MEGLDVNPAQGNGDFSMIQNLVRIKMAFLSINTYGLIATSN